LIDQIAFRSGLIGRTPQISCWLHESVRHADSTADYDCDGQECGTPKQQASTFHRRFTLGEVNRMRRCELILLIVAAAATWSLPSNAQQPAVPVIGFLNSASTKTQEAQYAAFHRGLKEAGYVDGQTVTIEYREADNHYDRLPALAADLVRRRVAVLVAAGGPVAALAAKSATPTIPVVFTTVSDPVKSGLVASLNRPGGNVTGTAGLTSELDAKRLELLHQIKPTDGAIGVLMNPNRPGIADQRKELEAAADKMKLKLDIQKAGTQGEIDAAFETFVQQRVDALLVTADPLFNSRRTQVVALAAGHSLPAIYQWREFAVAGGLMSYGPSITDAYYQTGIYVGRILKGAKTTDLPVMQPTKFELVINLKTARTLGLQIPPILLARVDEIVE
jgi:putative ABC transport system substrate-binding protein